MGNVDIPGICQLPCDFRRFADSMEAVRSSAVPPDVVCIDAGSIHVHEGCHNEFAAQTIERIAYRWSSATHLIYSTLGDVVNLDWVVQDFKKTVADARCIGTSRDIEDALERVLGLT